MCQSRPVWLLFCGIIITSGVAFQEALELNYQLLMVDVQQPIETICDVIVAAASSSK